MDQRRFILFLVLSMAILFTWTGIIVPKFFPFPQGNVDKNAADPDDAGQPAGPIAGLKPIADDADDADATADATAGAPVDAGAPAVGQDDVKATPKVAKAPKFDKPRFRHKEIAIGSLDRDSGYYQLVTLDTAGASVAYNQLNDPRYCKLDNRGIPLSVIGNTLNAPRTLEVSIEQIDRQLRLRNPETSLSKVNWEIVEKESDRNLRGVFSSVTFGYTSPDGTLEVRKRYWLNRLDVDDVDSFDVRDTQHEGYLLHLEFSVKNLGDEQTDIVYVLQGPVGVPLEDIKNTQTFREVKLEYYDENDAHIPLEQRSATATSVVAKTVANQVADDEVDVFKNSFRYIGIDVQFFTALLFPHGDQLKDDYFEVATPALIKKNNADLNHSDISIELTSNPVKLKSGEKFTHNFKLFLGPKRLALLEPLQAEEALDTGWFGFVSKPMLWLLKFFHDLGPDFPGKYGIAIICLTVLVRGCMYPISAKQARGAQKMKELQPKIAELKKKHGKDKEKMARAQMELFSKHKYNPLAGCLPLLLQFPIFIGLYGALRIAVDLRMAPFLWFDNLAAPDALFPLGFTIPWLKWSDFNLMPILAVALIFVQQKLFMPPAAKDDEQAQMQQKMMKYMMFFMGFIFYRMPSGLCVYFIASSLWGIGERKLLDIQKKKMDEKAPEPEDEPPSSKKKSHAAKPPDDQSKGGNGLWGRLVAAAEAAHEQKSNGKNEAGGNKNGSKKKKKKKKKSRR